MTEQRDWPDYAVQDWTEMERDNAIYAADLDEDLRRITDEQVEQSERSTALAKAIEAWRME